MLRPEVVQYLRDNLPKHPVESLRRQLLEEGVSEIDFDDCLTDALIAPKSATTSKKPAPKKPTSLKPATVKTATEKPKPSSKAVRFAFLIGFVLLAGAGLLALSRRSPSMPPPETQASAGSGESGFVGSNGWVVRLPKNYAGFSEFKDSSKTDEIVHFAPRGTDPTNFLDEGLFGQLGIVRLEVAPSQFPANMTGAASLANAVRNKTAAHGEKYVMKTIQIGTLPGVQVNIQSPFPRVEAYILGANDLYFFYGGQEDEIWRDIVLSLRDAHSEE